MSEEPDNERPDNEQPDDEQRVVAGRYRLLGPLGEGGMGVVWRARDDVLGREVAVKEVRAPSGFGATDGQRLYARLEREAWAAARISHRNVITVYDVATDEGRPWIVMELVRGLSLSDVLDAEGPMPARRAARIGAEVLAALSAAHGAGVLHRDVKPGNVLIANDGRIVLTDFGIALVEGSSALTMTGELIGSPEFLAPERALGRTPGPESDLWSLGVLLYAAVEGNSPFRQDTPLSTLRAVVDEELPRPARAGALTPVIEGLLRKDPAGRMSAAEAGRMLGVVAEGGTPAAGGAAAGPGPEYLTVTSSASASAPEGSPAPNVAVAGAATTRSTTTPERRPRRAALAAGAVALLLAVGGITWALVAEGREPATSAGAGSGSPGGGGEGEGSGSGGGDSGGGTGSGGSDGGGTDGGGTDGGSGTGDPTGGPTGKPSSSTGGTTTPPPAHQSVKVTVTAVRGSYSGACPPPEAQAPSFTATFTVGRVPVEVDYRWVTESGESSGGGWKTLSFAAGDGKSKGVNHTELTYKEGSAHEDEIKVEVRSPVAVTSDTVSFAVTCEEENPTGGASSSSSPSYSAQALLRRQR